MSEVVSPDPLPYDQNLHVAGTLDAGTGLHRLFINHREVASRVTSVRPAVSLNPRNGYGIGICGSPDGALRIFHGTIGALRISNLALSPSQFLPVPPEAPDSRFILSTPSSLRFVHQLHAPPPEAQEISLSNVGIQRLGFTLTTSRERWLSVSDWSGVKTSVPDTLLTLQTPEYLRVRVDPSGLDLGRYEALITIRSSEARNPIIEFRVTLSVVRTPPSFTPSGVVNSASYRRGPVAPGEMVTIFGTNLGPPSLTTLQLDDAGLVSTALAGTRVLFNGLPAPIIYAMSSQVGVVVPYAVVSSLTTAVEVEYIGIRSEPVVLAVAAAAPGLFTANALGSGQGAILNQDYSANSSENPAPRGSVVMLFGSGEGLTTPPGVDGKLAEPPLARPNLPVAVTVAGTKADIEYAGGAPGLVAGLLQVNVRIPLTTAPGSQPVLLTVNDSSPVTSQQGVTVAVR